MAYQNPFMDALSQGANAASRTSSVANSMMEGVQKSMDSSSDLVIKMDTLLKNEQHRKVQEQLQTQQLLQNQFQFNVNQQFNEKSLTAQENQWDIANKLNRDKFAETKKSNTVDRAYTKLLTSNAKQKQEEWNELAPLRKAKTNATIKALNTYNESSTETPSTLTPPSAPDKQAYDSQVKLLTDKANLVKKGLEDRFNSGQINEEQYVDAVDNIDMDLDKNMQTYASNNLSNSYDAQKATYDIKKKQETISNLRNEANAAKALKLPFTKQGELDQLVAEEKARTDAIKQVVKDQPTQKELANKVIEVAKDIAKEDGISMEEAIPRATSIVKTGYGGTLNSGVAPTLNYNPPMPNLSDNRMDDMYTKDSKTGNKIARTETKKTRNVMDSIPTVEGKSQYAKTPEVIKLGSQLIRMDGKESYKQYDYLTDGMPQKTKEIYDNAVFRNTLATSDKVYLGKDGKWHGKFDTDYKQGEAMDFKVKTMNDNTSTDVFAQLKQQVGGQGIFSYGMEGLIAGIGFGKTHTWKNLSGSKKMRKFDEITSKGKEYPGVTPYTTIGAYAPGMKGFVDNTKNWGVDFTMGMMGASLNEAGEKIYKGKVINADGTEGTLAPYFINNSVFIDKMEKSRPKGGLIEVPEKTWATGGSLLDAFNPNSDEGISNQPMTAKEAREKFNKYNESLTPVQHKAVADNSISFIRALQQYADNEGVIIDSKVAVDHPSDKYQVLYLNNLNTGNTEQVKMSIKDIYLGAIAMFGGIVDK